MDCSHLLLPISEATKNRSDVKNQLSSQNIKSTINAVQHHPDDTKRRKMEDHIKDHRKTKDSNKHFDEDKRRKEKLIKIETSRLRLIPRLQKKSNKILPRFQNEFTGRTCQLLRLALATALLEIT